MKKFPKKCNDAIASAICELQGVNETMESYFDDKSEKWQGGDAGRNYRSWIEQVETAIEALENLPDELPPP